ncbi:DUF262 domain-containing protein [Clostridium sp. DJ247]|uniref:DUF262 domain-containing protein n=1 Tax=Clostridium sp. DJ247 TaxID=2726188 RepID=UPI0016270A3C|nr:DUF262 domain-containing protein [Clostridium sp. DJ247]MBC2579958.1 DUF262 domain-containing protein [Clostridium sp. DJ247]
MRDNIKIKELVDYVYNGEVVLPDFQRSFIWEPEDLRELLVSVLGDYFIGSMLVLDDIYKEDSPFALRLIEGVTSIKPDAQIRSVVSVILDGQQRTTALFYALYEPQISLKGRKSVYRFYIDLEKALQGDWDKAVIAAYLNDKRKINAIKSNKYIIPFSSIRDLKEITKQFKDNEEFEGIYDLIKRVLDKEINIIKLPRNTELEKIVETFERINRTGEPLSIFDLTVARLFKYGIKLRDLLSKAKDEYESIRIIKPDMILKTISLIRNGESKRKNILSLSNEDFVKDWEFAIVSLDKAYKRIVDIKSGYGVYNINKWIPYSTMIVPLAAMLHFIRISNIENLNNYAKIDKWYWSSVFSSRYDQGVDSTSASDYKIIKDWILDNSKTPDFIKNFNVSEDKLDVDSKTSAIYKGIINLIVLEGALDFKTGNPIQFDDESIQDDHIFPKSKYKMNLISNRTLITSNASKGDKSTSIYFEERIREQGKEAVIKILKSHLINEEALNYLLNDDIKNFMLCRKKVILDKINNFVSIK